MKEYLKDHSFGEFLDYWNKRIKNDRPDDAKVGLEKFTYARLEKIFKKCVEDNMFFSSPDKTEKELTETLFLMVEHEVKWACVRLDNEFKMPVEKKYGAEFVKELMMLGKTKVVHIREDWNDIDAEPEKAEPLNFDYIVPDCQKEMCEAEIYKAFDNWMNEECQDSILISEELSAQDLCCIPVGDYIGAWLEKKQIYFTDISDYYEKMIYDVAERMSQGEGITADMLLEQCPRTMEKLADYLYTDTKTYDFWSDDENSLQLVSKARNESIAEMKKEFLPVIKAFYEEYKTMKDEIKKGFLSKKQIAFINQKLDLNNRKDEELSPLWFAVDDLMSSLMLDQETGTWKSNIAFESDTDSALKEVINVQANERRKRNAWTLDFQKPKVHKKKKTL